MNMIACSATGSAFASPAVTTAMPHAVAASISTLSTPAPCLWMILRCLAFSSVLRVTKEYIPVPGKYELGVKITLKNASDQPLEAQYAIVAAGPTLPEIEAVLRRLREAGARLVVASNSSEALAYADIPLRLPEAPEWLSPLSAIIPGQLFAYHLALAKQIDPDHPRHIQKVTRTE